MSSCNPCWRSNQPTTAGDVDAATEGMEDVERPALLTSWLHGSVAWVYSLRSSWYASDSTREPTEAAKNFSLLSPAERPDLVTSLKLGLDPTAPVITAVYRFDQVLGRGAFGEVVLGVHIACAAPRPHLDTYCCTPSRCPCDAP